MNIKLGDKIIVKGSGYFEDPTQDNEIGATAKVLEIYDDTVKVQFTSGNQIQEVPFDTVFSITEGKKVLKYRPKKEDKNKVLKENIMRIEENYNKYDVVEVAAIDDSGFAIQTSDGNWADSSFAVVLDDMGSKIKIQYVDEEAEITTVPKSDIAPADNRAVKMIRRNYPWFFESKEIKQGDKEIIEITEDVRIPGTDVIFEAGDKIEVIKEAAPMLKVKEKQENIIIRRQEMKIKEKIDIFNVGRSLRPGFYVGTYSLDGSSFDLEDDLPMSHDDAMDRSDYLSSRELGDADVIEVTRREEAYFVNGNSRNTEVISTGVLEFYREGVQEKQNSTEIIKITEDVRVPGTHIILEKGDKIEVLKESYVSSFGIAEEIADWVAENLSLGQEMQKIVWDLLDDTRSAIARDSGRSREFSQAIIDYFKK